MSYAEAQYVIDSILDEIRKSQMGGLPPKPPKRVVAMPAGNKIRVRVDPADPTVLDGYEVSKPYGHRVCVKKDRYSQNPFDYDAFEDVRAEEQNWTTTGNQQGSWVDITGLESTGNYYVSVYTHSYNGMYSLQPARSSKVCLPDGVFGFKQTINSAQDEITLIGSASGMPFAFTDKGSPKYRDFKFSPWTEWSFLRKNKRHKVNNEAVSMGEMNSVTDEPEFGVQTNAGVYSWLPTLYMNFFNAGSYRQVLMSTDKGCLQRYYDNSGDSMTIVTPGFLNRNSQTVKGLWLPLYYDDGGGDSFGNKRIETNASAEGFLSGARFVNGKWKLYGGPLVNTLRDVLYMIYGVTDLHRVMGLGAANPEAIGDLDSYRRYVPEEMFIGDPMSVRYPSVSAFGSIIFSNVVYLLDPYTMSKNGQLSYSLTDKFDDNGRQYFDTGRSFAATGSIYPTRFITDASSQYLAGEFFDTGATNLDPNIPFYTHVEGPGVGVKIATRGKSYRQGTNVNIGTIGGWMGVYETHPQVGAAFVGVPDVNYSP